MQSLTFTLPIYWVNERKTKKSTTHLVGDNYVHTAHFQTIHKLKQHYYNLIAEALSTNTVSNLSKFTVHYDLYYKNPSSDPSNIIHRIEKFTLDGLQVLRVLSNDNVLHHLGSSYSVIDQDRLNPRVEVTITEVL